MKDHPLIEAWNRAVGPQIGARAQPDRLRDGVLYVRVCTSVWMHELQFMKQDIMARLNEVLGSPSVSQVRFFIGEIDAPRAKPDAPVMSIDAAALKADEKAYIDNTLAGITDPELREILLRTMSRSILQGRKPR